VNAAASAQLLEAPAQLVARAPAAPPAEDPAAVPVHPADQIPSDEPTLSLLLAASDAARVAQAPTPAAPNVFSPAILEACDTFLAGLSTLAAVAARLVRSLRTGSARW
jgi:hypothetical protein